MGATLGAPVHKGLKARTEANRAVPIPYTAKDQIVMKLRLKIPILCVKESKYRMNQKIPLPLSNFGGKTSKS